MSSQVSSSAVLLTGLIDESALLTVTINEFALALYHSMRGDPDLENLFFSPFSIVSALMMTLMGAKDATAKQMKEALKAVHLEDTTLGETCAKLTAMLKTQEGSGYVLHVANSLFARQGYSFLEEYLSVTRKHFQAEAQTLDFAGDSEGSRQTINKWVEDQTAQKIKDLFTSGSISANTTMVLASAIYFKGDWDEMFNAEYTRKMSFNVTPFEVIQVDMMFKNAQFRCHFCYESHCQSIELPYKGKDLSMVCVLPDDRFAELSQLEDRLTPAMLRPLLECPATVGMGAWIPKFKIRHFTQLKPKLQTLGMCDLFEAGKADLSGMVHTKGDVYISEVLHEAVLEVHEQGSEAAAAAAMDGRNCIPMNFQADHPFLVFVKDNRSGAILFMGRVVRP